MIALYVVFEDSNVLFTEDNNGEHEVLFFLFLNTDLTLKNSKSSESFKGNIPRYVLSIKYIIMLSSEDSNMQPIKDFLPISNCKSF